MQEQLESLIMRGCFSAAAELLNGVTSKRELYKILLYLGGEERYFCAYAFTWFLMQNDKEDAELHYIAYRIVTQNWPFLLNNCYAVAAFHLRRAMFLSPENKKYLKPLMQIAIFCSGTAGARSEKRRKTGLPEGVLTSLVPLD